ncbi:hypothetical protein FEM48_Zijuj02G0109200 [Ziziphus jujuba var. spinosa]|uniref:Uncharacterized protein n=1 Tax=Ziziphus jujuba var. spinosa TaxID=714518 RepID=A0A978VVB8_ZIZJJ|nr:hypothetical protein FEM48_Zijuj02G0109200 [Ziziphus jujuba var. spinosa]
MPFPLDMWQGQNTCQAFSWKTNVENDDPTYAKLSQPIHENLLTTYVQISNRKENKVDKILHELLRNGDWARRYMQGSRSKKIDEWIHLDNCVQGVSTGSPVRALKIHSKSSKKHMSMKQHTKLGSFDLPPEHRRKDQLAQCLLDADLRGAIISVVPKKVSVFIFQVDCWKITLKGNKTYDSYHISKTVRRPYGRQNDLQPIQFGVRRGVRTHDHKVKSLMSLKPGCLI